MPKNALTLARISAENHKKIWEINPDPDPEDRATQRPHLV